jgi:hypothetical protein
VDEDEAENAPFTAIDTRRRAGNNNALRSDHLAHNSATGVGGSHDEAMMYGEIPSCWAVNFCRFPKRTFEEVSEPVEAVPSQPINVPKKG